MENLDALLDQIRDKKVYVQVKNEEQEKLLTNELFDNEIPFDSFSNPRDNKTAYKVSEKAYQYFVKKGIELEVLKVKNIGDLSSEERRKVKEYTRALYAKRRAGLLRELREKYGPI